MPKAEALLYEVILFFQPIAEAIEDEDTFANFFQQFGYDLRSWNLAAIFAEVGSANPSLESAFNNLVKSSVSESGDVVEISQGFFSSLEALSNASSLQSVISDGEALLLEVFDYLTDNYLSTRIPFAAALLKALGVITVAEVKPTDAEGRDFDYHKVAIRWGRLGDFIRNPGEWAHKVYGWSGNPAAGDLRSFDYEAAIGNIAYLIEATQLAITRYRQMTPSEAAAFLKNSGVQTVFEAAIPAFQGTFDHVDPDGTPVFSSEAGLKIVPFGDLNQPEELGLALAPYVEGQADGDYAITPNLHVNVDAGAAATGGAVLVIQPNGLHVEGAASADLTFDFGVHYGHEDKSETVLFGLSNATRLAADAITATVGGALDGDLYVTVGMNKLRLVLDVSGDAFLGTLLSSPIEVDAGDLLVGWRSGRGIYFEGGTGLETTLPLHIDLFGIAHLQSLYLALLAGADGDQKAAPLTALAALTFTAKLGPIKGAIERVGLKTGVDFPEGGGNFGPADLVLGFKPPDGAGLAIDAAVVTGGGYLFRDPAKGQYAGILQLSVKEKLTLTAIGLLTTPLPGRTDGFSLLVIIAAEFPPVQLGYGFSLSGVGGLLGLNRTMVLDVLRAGVKNRTLDSILFPQDPIENAPQIVSDLQNAFPPVPEQFVVGPMAILGWGTPQILSLELGILIEFPDPIRLAILGTLRMILPSKDVKPVAVQLQMDILGAVDFDKGDVSIDATLYDSHVAGFPVSGDMALRANFGASPTLALSAGGFNPRFLPPPAFPALERLAITIAKGDNPRLRLEAYLALTSNTAQVGARLDLYAAADFDPPVGALTVEGVLGFDTLFHFVPFEFVADIYASATLKRSGKPLLALDVAMTLTGPRPYHAWGKATFEFLGKHSIAFDATIGERDQPPALPPSRPFDALIDALELPGNWSARLPGAGQMLVSLRESTPPAGVVVLHPLGDLEVRQRAVPLEQEISRYGSTEPDGPRRFTIAAASLDGTSVAEPDLPKLKDKFAPAQFRAMSDDEKLSAPAFEELQSGVRIGAGGFTLPHDDLWEKDVPFDYETSVMDVRDVVPKKLGRISLGDDLFGALVAQGAAALSPMARTGEAKFRGTPLGISLREPTYAVASTDDLATGDFSQPDDGSHAAAVDAVRAHLSANPGAAGTVQVVGRQEVVSG